MELTDYFRLIHPALAVIIVFPLIGMVANFAWQTRQRRLAVTGGGKSKIPPVVGPEHFQWGRWLTAAVVGLALLGMARPIFSKILTEQTWNQAPFKVIFTVLLFAATLASLVLLYRSRPKIWRAVFATLTGMGLVILGFQTDAAGNSLVFRRDYEWQVSHFYYGLAAAFLMIFSLAIAPDIYQDRSQRWRKLHAILNLVALLFFIGQGITGARDLLEIPLSWQEPYIYSCDFNNKTCPTPPPPSPQS